MKIDVCYGFCFTNPFVMTKSLNYDKETKQVHTLKLNEAFLLSLLGIGWTEKQYYPIYLFRHTH